MTLPSVIVVRACTDMFMMFETRCVNGYWKLNTIEYPVRRVSQGRWGDDGGMYESRQYSHSCDSGHIVNSMQQQPTYISIPGSENVYEYTLNKLCTIMGYSVSNVLSGRDNEKKWHFTTTDVMAPLASAPSAPLASAPLASAPAAARIPPHILAGFIEYCISQNQECPITMEPLTRSTIGLTPCGHVFNATALLEAVERSHSCPNCRTHLDASSIQRC